MSNGARRGYLRSFSRPGWWAGLSAIGLGGSYLVSVQDPVPAWELSWTEAINGVPDAVAVALYPIMQLGTLGAPIVVAAGIVLARKDWWLAGATVITGGAAWFGAKAIKNYVERPRPLEFLPELDVREGDGTGLGFVSGHSAVAMSAAVMAMAALPRRWRPVAALVAGLVGLARIVHGVHLPADVVGGWSFGALLALAALGILDLVADRRTKAVADAATPAG